MRTDTGSAIRARLIAAMAQRAASLDGEARRALEDRLARWQALETDAPDHAPDGRANTPAPGPLRDLLDHIGRDGCAQDSAYPDVPALADFRQLWSTLRSDSQVRQSIVQPVADAGPLNSSALACRAIALMREQSPAYLRSFLAYVDDLAWLEQMDNAGFGTGSATTGKKRARRKTPG